MKTAEAEETLNSAMDLLADFRDDEAENLINAFVKELKSAMDGTVVDADRNYYWGRGLSLLEEPEQALLRFEKALQIKPDHEGALWETTTLLLYELDRPEGAKAILEKSLLPLRPGYGLYEEALAASETLIRIQITRPAKKGGEDIDEEFPESEFPGAEDEETETPV